MTGHSPRHSPQDPLKTTRPQSACLPVPLLCYSFVRLRVRIEMARDLAEIYQWRHVAKCYLTSKNFPTLVYCQSVQASPQQRVITWPVLYWRPVQSRAWMNEWPPSGGTWVTGQRWWRITFISFTKSHLLSSYSFRKLAILHSITMLFAEEIFVCHICP